jgi:hypothetical protein
MCLRRIFRHHDQLQAACLQATDLQRQDLLCLRVAWGDAQLQQLHGDARGDGGRVGPRIRCSGLSSVRTLIATHSSPVYRAGPVLCSASGRHCGVVWLTCVPAQCAGVQYSWVACECRHSFAVAMPDFAYDVGGRFCKIGCSWLAWGSWEGNRWVRREPPFGLDTLTRHPGQRREVEPTGRLGQRRLLGQVT